MARDPKLLRKAYETKLGKDLAAKLSDDQIGLISKYYNSLSDKEQSNVDSRILKGYNDTELHEMARGFVEESEEETTQVYDPGDKLVDDTQEKLDENLKETSDSIMDEIDRIIDEYKEKVRRGKEVGNGTSSALATIPKRTNYQERGTDKEVEEDIDPEILKLLGLEDATDLTYDEYKTLLKEKMVSGRMVDSEMSFEDTELLTNEFKRVRSNTGQFVIKSRSPLDGSIGRESSTSSPTNTESVNTIIEKSSEVNAAQDDKINYALVTLPDALNNITSVLSDINNVIAAQVAVNEADLEDKQQQDIVNQRKKEEEQGEKKKKGFLSRLKNIRAPKFDFFDAIKNFFTNVAIGGALAWLFKWVQDPENQEKMDQISDMVEKWLPWVLGGLLALALLPVASTLLTMLGAVKGAFVGLIAVIKGLSPVLLPVLAALGLVLADAKPSGGFDQNYGESAVYLDPDISPEQKIMLIENQFKGTPAEKDLTKWPKSAVDTYAEAHRELGKDLPQWFIDQRASGAQGIADIESDQMQGPSLGGVDEEKQKQIEELQKQLNNLEKRLALQVSSGQADPRTVKRTKEQIQSIKDRMGALGYTEPTDPSTLTADDVRPGGKMSDFNYYSGEYGLNMMEKGGGNDELRVPGVGTVRKDRGFMGMGRESLRYYDQDTGKEVSAEDFRKKFESMKPEGYDPENLRRGGQTPSSAEVQPQETAPVEPTPDSEVSSEEPASVEPTPAAEVQPPTPAEVEQKPTGMEVVPEMEGAERSEKSDDNIFTMLNAQIRENSVKIPKPPGSPSITVLPVPVTEKGSTSSSNAAQKDPPVISASDPNNDNLLITKSVYNIIQ